MHITYRCVQNAAFTGLPSCFHMLSGKLYKQALLFITCLNPIILLLSVIFSSPEHKVLKVSYCDHPVSGVRRPSSVVRRVSSTIHSKHISS